MHPTVRETVIASLLVLEIGIAQAARSPIHKRWLAPKQGLGKLGSRLVSVRSLGDRIRSLDARDWRALRGQVLQLARARGLSKRVIQALSRLSRAEIVRQIEHTRGKAALEHPHASLLAHSMALLVLGVLVGTLARGGVALAVDAPGTLPITLDGLFHHDDELPKTIETFGTNKTAQLEWMAGYEAAHNMTVPAEHSSFTETLKGIPSTIKEAIDQENLTDTLKQGAKTFGHDIKSLFQSHPSVNPDPVYREALWQGLKDRADGTYQPINASSFDPFAIQRRLVHDWEVLSSLGQLLEPDRFSFTDNRVVEKLKGFFERFN